MKIFSRFMAQFGFVRLKDYGYELTAGGKIVQVEKVEDDRFAPPPWQPVAWQSASSLLPPAPARPPEPRPLAPPPRPELDEGEPAPLFKVPGEVASVETRAPASPATAEAEEDSISIDEVPEEEEWEWKMALARARENAEKDKKEREKAKQERMAARRGDTPAFQTSQLPLAAPPARASAKVVDSPKPMSKIARPAPRPIPARPAPARIEPRAVTAQPVAKSAPRTAPPKAPPGSKSRQMEAAQPQPDKKPASRASLEKSVSRVFSPAAGAQPRPLPRLARGTESPASSNARPTRPQMALGSSRLPAVRDPSADVTATDITAVDRAQASMKEDEDTRVNVAVLPPSAEITLDITLDPEEKTTVDPKPNGVPMASVGDGSSPLPRLTARLRRQSVPN